MYNIGGMPMRKGIKTEDDVIQELKEIFSKNCEKRILVLGTTCSGKTTLLKSFPEGRDMDIVVRGIMPKELQDEFNKVRWPWPEDLLKTWNEYLAKAIKTVKIEPGHPLFAATVFDSI